MDHMAYANNTPMMNWWGISRRIRIGSHILTEKGLQMYSHPYYGALLDNLRNDEGARLNNEQKWLDYRKSNDPAPFEPFVLPDSPFITPAISEAGDSAALVDVIENEEIQRPYLLPPLVGEDSMAQGLLREDPPNYCYNATSSVRGVISRWHNRRRWNIGRQ